VLAESFNQTRGADSIEGGSTGTDTLTLIASGATVGATGATTAGSVINMGTTAVSAAAIVGTVANYVAGSLSEIGTGKAGYLFGSSSTLNSADLDTIGGIEDIVGGNGVDYIVGSANNNSITGAAGADYIDGGDGNDTIIISGAGDGNSDKMHGGLGTDTLTVSANTTVSTTNADITGIENITVTGTTALVLTGQSDDFVITASAAGVQQITGGTGDDTITLDGSGDTATDIVSIASTGTDTITGFTAAGEDDISLDDITGSTALTALTGGGGANTIVTDKVYLIAGGAAGSADAGASTAAATKIDATMDGSGALTDDANGDLAYFVLADNNSSAVFKYTATAANAGVTAAELTLLATVDAVLATGEIIFT
jgi:hypothetical protein